MRKLSTKIDSTIMGSNLQLEYGPWGTNLWNEKQKKTKKKYWLQ
jgi:hypothetical protein